MRKWGDDKQRQRNLRLLNGGPPPRMPLGALLRRDRTVVGGLIVAALLVGPVLLANASVAVKGAVFRGDGCGVVRVVDGDTVTLYCDGRGLLRTRLMGFDTPELYASDCLGEKLQALQATAYLGWRYLRAGEVSVVMRGTDRYDRKLARMRLDGKDVADVMIDAGLARAYAGGRRASWCAGALPPKPQGAWNG